LYDPVKKRIHVSRDVIFDEGAGWNWGELDGNTSPLTVESWTLSQPPAAAVKSFREEADVAPASPTGL
jgi:hypothetical protein